MRSVGPILLAFVVVALFASWTAWDRSYALQDALTQATELQQDIQNLETRNEILKSAIRQVRGDSSAGPFLTGWVAGDDGGQAISWPVPRDGLYLVVSPRCSWCLPLLRDLDEVGKRFGSPIYVLADDARGVDRFLDAEGVGRPDALIEPVGGWWNVALPKEVTPIWLRYEDGVFVEFGLGAPGDEEGGAVSTDGS